MPRLCSLTSANNSKFIAALWDTSTRDLPVFSTGSLLRLLEEEEEEDVHNTTMVTDETSVQEVFSDGSSHSRSVVTRPDLIWSHRSWFPIDRVIDVWKSNATSSSDQAPASPL